MRTQNLCKGLAAHLSAHKLCLMTYSASGPSVCVIESQSQAGIVVSEPVKTVVQL